MVDVAICAVKCMEVTDYVATYVCMGRCLHVVANYGI